MLIWACLCWVTWPSVVDVSIVSFVCTMNVVPPFVSVGAFDTPRLLVLLVISGLGFGRPAFLPEDTMG